MHRIVYVLRASYVVYYEFQNFMVHAVCTWMMVMDNQKEQGKKCVLFYKVL